MDIRLATLADVPRIMEFIKENWSSQHILANKEEMILYQHMGRKENEFTYVLAEEDGKIYGIEGYILMNGDDEPDIAGALWKVIPSNYFMLGKAIRDSLKELTKCRHMCSPGINMNTSGRVLGMYGDYVEKMDHYYRIRDLEEYRIAVINEKRIVECTSEDDVHLEYVSDFEDMSRYLSEEYLRTKIPYKDKKYLKHRYFEHPVYKYDVYAVVSKAGRSFVVIREVNKNGTKMAKIVDFIGEDEHLAGMAREWDKLAESKGYEYIDIYCYGIEEEIMKKSGFTKRLEEDVNIIPNYFDPFEQRNVDIYFVSNVLEGLHLYRGDGDQDRPSSY